MLTVLIRYKGKEDNVKHFIKLREKYDLHMEVEKYQSILDDRDEKYIRR